MFKIKFPLQEEVTDETNAAAGAGGGEGGGNGSAASPAGGDPGAAAAAAAAASAAGGAAAEPALGKPGQEKTPDQIKTGMHDAISKVLDANAAEVKAEDAAAKKKAEEATAAAAGGGKPAAGGEQKATIADARKYLVAKGKTSDLAGKTDEQILAMHDAAKKAEKPAAKEADEVLFKQPDGLKPEGQARFKKLVEEVKSERGRAEKAEAAAASGKQTVEGFRQILTETQTTPEDLSQLLEYNRLVKSGDLENALKLLDMQRAAIAHQLGRPVDGVDQLEGFDDLRADVKDMKITMDRAVEIAAGRRAKAAEAARGVERQKSEQQQGAQRQARDKALREIAAFATEKSKSDIDYPKKEEQLLKAIDRIAARFPPHLWVEQLEMLYETITAAVTPAAATAAAGAGNGAAAGSGSQPLRPNSGGGGRPAPKSMAEALDQGLGYGPAA
jgi:hypothetical protein